jgi:hypothetical protein
MIIKYKHLQLVKLILVTVTFLTAQPRALGQIQFDKNSILSK